MLLLLLILLLSLLLGLLTLLTLLLASLVVVIDTVSASIYLSIYPASPSFLRPCVSKLSLPSTLFRAYPQDGPWDMGYLNTWGVCDAQLFPSPSSLLLPSSRLVLGWGWAFFRSVEVIRLQNFAPPPSASIHGVWYGMVQILPYCVCACVCMSFIGRLKPPSTRRRIGGTHPGWRQNRVLVPGEVSE